MNPNWIKWSEQVHRAGFEELSEVRETISKSSPEELTDIGWILKKMYANLDDLRKEINKLKALAEKVACVKALADDKDKIRGKLATGTPSASQSFNVPHPEKAPEDWRILCDYFELPEGASDNDVIRFHYPGIEAFFTRLAEQGRPLPKGLDLNKVTIKNYLKYRGVR